MHHKLIAFIVSNIIACMPLQVGAKVILEDDFEAGEPKDFWLSDMSATTSNPKDGTYSAEMFFEGGPPEADASAEARFKLGGAYPEVTITFDLYIPENYEHRETPSSDNNKFLRIWATDGSDREEIGASMSPDGTGDSIIGSDYRKAAHKGMSTSITSAEGFIVGSDHGKWMQVEIYVKAPTDTSSAVLRINKNGTPFLIDKFDNNYNPGTQGFQGGYLLGWANSGFDEDTRLYIDNVEFHDVNLSDTIPESPSGVSVDVESEETSE